jgi:hypothetical protein
MREEAERMKLKLAAALITAGLILGVAGCSSEPPKENKQEAKPAEQAPEFLTGRSAFQKMYAVARIWASDAQPIRVESFTNAKNPKDGSAIAWTAKFASPSQGKVRSYTWSGGNGKDTPSPGVSAGGLDIFSPTNISTQPFEMSFWKIDSAKAFEVAQRKGGEQILKKHPDTKMRYVLYWEANKGRLTWQVVYGSESTALVDASTGQFVRMEK